MVYTCIHSSQAIMYRNCTLILYIIYINFQKSHEVLGVEPKLQEQKAGEYMHVCITMGSSILHDVQKSVTCAVHAKLPFH